MQVPLGPYQVFYDDPETARCILAYGDKYEAHLTEEMKKEWAHTEFAGGFMDIGANIGYHTVMAKCFRGPQFPTVSVEVNPKNVALLCRTIKENGFWNSLVLPVAASDEVGTVYGNDSWNTGLSRTRINDDWRWLYPAMPLDLFDCGPIKTIKIDVEGFELATLRGLSKTISVDRPTLFFEYNLHCMNVVGVDPLDLLNWVLQAGYDLTTLEYREGMTAHFTDAVSCRDHIAKFGIICDIMAKPI